jgi:hypothetical protein
MRRDDKVKPQAQRNQKSSQEKVLDQELDDSFPASDPPQSTQPGGRVGDPHRSIGDVKGNSKREKSS